MDSHHWPLNLCRGKTSSPESGLPSPASGHIKGGPVMGRTTGLWYLARSTSGVVPHVTLTRLRTRRPQFYVRFAQIFINSADTHSVLICDFCERVTRLILVNELLPGWLFKLLELSSTCSSDRQIIPIRPHGSHRTHVVGFTVVHFSLRRQAGFENLHIKMLSSNLFNGLPQNSFL